MSPNRLVNFPFVIVRVSCTRCARAGSYRLARLAEKYGAEVQLPELLSRLSGDCPMREQKIASSFTTCGAQFPDLVGPRPPDAPPGVPPGGPPKDARLRVVRDDDERR